VQIVGGVSHGRNQSLREASFGGSADYESSRLELAQLSAAYERVLPEIRVVLAESRCRTKSSTASPIVFASESVGMQSGLYAMGGHFS